jgi:hypothetical protein
MTACCEGAVSDAYWQDVWPEDMFTSCEPVSLRESGGGLGAITGALAYATAAQEHLANSEAEAARLEVNEVVRILLDA